MCYCYNRGLAFFNNLDEEKLKETKVINNDSHKRNG